jgi:hypothetical protein
VNINSAFPSKFLKASDLNGQAVNVKISGVKVESVGQGQESKPVVYFAGKQKGMVLNKTNAGKIANIAGSQDTDDWADVVVQIYPTETEFGGETVECIRVRPPKAGARKLPPPEPEHDGGDLVNDDSDPF